MNGWEVVELGSGSGIGGLAAWRHGAKAVTLTDRAEVISLIDRNIGLNVPVSIVVRVVVRVTVRVTDRVTVRVIVIAHGILISNCPTDNWCDACHVSGLRLGGGTK